MFAPVRNRATIPRLSFVVVVLSLNVTASGNNLTEGGGGVRRISGNFKGFAVPGGLRTTAVNKSEGSLVWQTAKQRGV